ncbi:MAG: hypothetical protein OXH39_06590 [Candidatus Poribacteria bacterium]|nr:hypothetical protein [Candidatus Poribacteria bacterium]
MIKLQQQKSNTVYLIRFVVILIGWGCIAVLPTAAENYTGDFLTNGVGGRALGLGGAYVGIADDATAAYWNPAGIAGVPDKYQFCLMHAARRSGLGSFNYVGGTTQVLPNLNLGVSWLRAGVDDIPIYPLVPAFDPNISSEQRRNLVKNRPRESDFIPAGYLNDSENAYILTLAKRWVVSQSWWDNFGRDSVPPEFMVGVNTKLITQSVGGSDLEAYNYGSWGYGFDVGMLVRLPDFNALFGLEDFGSLTFGMNLQDISKTTLTWNTLSAPKESIPANWNMGVAYTNNRVFNRELILSYQWQQRYGGQMHLGIEYHISKPLALRVGYRDNRITSGIGIQLRKFRLDYALLFGDLISTHFLSLLWHF